jgi:3-oxoacyl-[acyl-carrier-protein] synthase II
MKSGGYVITGIGVLSPFGLGKEAFWAGLNAGKDAVSDIESFSTEKFSVKRAAEVKNFDPKTLLGPKGLRNLDRTTLFLLAAAKLALDDAKIEITDANTDDFGICTGTTFPHLWSIIEFDSEVIKEGLNFSNPALFPSTVINAASSQISIRYNIQGFNATISTGYTSSLEALKYSMLALETAKAKTILVGAVESLSMPLFFGFHKLGYMAGIKGDFLNCPFDKRRNGPVLGEAAVFLVLEAAETAKARGAPFYARIKSAASYFDGYKIGKIHPRGEGLAIAVRQALEEAGLKSVDYISSCANSSKELDKIEVKVLKEIFNKNLENIPVSAIKSMLGETFSVSGALQIVSSIMAIKDGVLPPTINYKEKDQECDIDCIPNTARKAKADSALVLSSGPGGYNSACVLGAV